MLPHGSGHPGGFYDDPDLFPSQRSRGFGYGGLPASQPAFPFTGFPLHSTHDHMGLNGEYDNMGQDAHLKATFSLNDIIIWYSEQ